MLTLLSFWAGKKLQKRKDAAVNRGLKLLIIEEKNTNKKALNLLAGAIERVEDRRGQQIAEAVTRFIDDGKLEDLERRLEVVAAAPE